MTVDIWSKGEVVSYLKELLANGHIKSCLKLKVEQGYKDAYYPECVEDWASRRSASNVYTDPTAYDGPSGYWWPQCPADCPGSQQSDDFVRSLVSELVTQPETSDHGAQSPNSNVSGGLVRDVFIIHGHDEANKLKLQNLLTDRFKLNAIVLSDTPGQGQTLIEKFERAAKTSAFAFVLITPDDIVKTEKGKYAQARPNVIFELGWFCGRRGRSRMCILLKKGTKIHFDLDGVSRIEFTDSVEEKFLEIEKELKAAKLVR